MMENRCQSPFLIQGGFLNQLFQFLCCFSAVLTIMAIGLSHLYQEGTFKVVAYQPISAFIHLNQIDSFGSSERNSRASPL